MQQAIRPGIELVKMHFKGPTSTRNACQREPYLFDFPHGGTELRNIGDFGQAVEIAVRRGGDWIKT